MNILTWLSKQKDNMLIHLLYPTIKHALVKALDAYELSEPATQYGFSRLETKLAAEDSARYIMENMPLAKELKTKNEIIEWSVNEAKVDGLVLDFGVGRGGTIKTVASQTNQKVYGFDSFRGVDKAWTREFHMKQFDFGGELPKDLPSNVELVVGYFEDTLPNFVEKHNQPIRYLRIDSDIYESAKTILTTLQPNIVPGTIIVFDEYLNYPGWQRHEHRAFQEFVSDNNVRFEYIGFSFRVGSVAIRIIEI